MATDEGTPRGEARVRKLLWEYQEHVKAMAKGRKIGVAGVDTGMLLIVDPAYLFGEQEWLEVVGKRADELGKDYPRAILQILAEKTGLDMERLAVIAEMTGDGGRQVTRTDDGVFIED